MSTFALEHASAIVSPNKKSVLYMYNVDLLPLIHIIAGEVVLLGTLLPYKLNHEMKLLFLTFNLRETILNSGSVKS